MEDAVFVYDSRLGEVVVAEFDSVREEKGLGGRFDNMEAAVVIEGGVDVEAIAASEGPRSTCDGFIVDDDRAYDEAKGSGIKVEGAVVVFSGGHFRGEGGLTKKIEGEFGLRQKLVPKEVGEGFGEDDKDA